MSKNRKSTPKRYLFILLVFLAVLCMGSLILLYNFFRFSATVTDKYVVETPGEWIVFKTHKIEADTWFGDSTFCVEKNIYEMIEVGNEYSFQREIPFVNYVIIRE